MGVEMLQLCNKTLGARKCKGRWELQGQAGDNSVGVEREENFTQILFFKCHKEELERWPNG